MYPLRFALSPGQASDISNSQALLDKVRISDKPGRPRKHCRWLLVDNNYDAEHLRQYCDRYRMRPVIQLRTMKRKTKRGLPRLFDRTKYQQRNIIERMFGQLKESRRIGTRYDKLAKNFCCNGHAGLCATLFSPVFFVQNLTGCCPSHL